MELLKIKFKGKRVDNNEWVSGWLIGYDRTFIVKSFVWDHHSRTDIKTINPILSEVYEVILETVERDDVVTDNNLIEEKNKKMIDTLIRNSFLPVYSITSVVTLDKKVLTHSEVIETLYLELMYMQSVASNKDREFLTKVHKTSLKLVNAFYNQEFCMEMMDHYFTVERSAYISDQSVFPNPQTNKILIVKKKDQKYIFPFPKLLGEFIYYLVKAGIDLAWKEMNDGK